MKNNQYVDLISTGEIGPTGILDVTGVDAVVNALRLWFVSFSGEAVRRPEYGGYLTKWILKPLNEETRMDIRNAIRVGIENSFGGLITINNLGVVPDYNTESWSVTLNATVNAIGEEFTMNEKLRRQR